MSHLRVVGRLYPDGRLRLRPCYLAERPPWQDREGAGDGLLELELLTGDGGLLGRHPLRAYPVCALGGGSRALAVRGWVPFHPDTRALRILHRGRVVHEQRRSPEPPRVEIGEAPEGLAEGRVRIAWRAAPGGAAPLQFFLRYSADGGRRWQRIGWRTEAHEAVVDVDDLPGGEECLVAVVATDGIDTTVAESRPFAVAPKPCQAIVIAPVDGSEVADGVAVELMGHGWWLEEARAEREALEWTSSLDGPLGRGPRLEVRLSAGEHRITLAAGAGPRRGEGSVVVRCGGPRGE